MMSTSSAHAAQLNPVTTVTTDTTKVRRTARGSEPTIFTDIYQEETNIAIWQRELSTTLKCSVNDFVESNPTFQTSITVTPQNVLSSIRGSLGTASEELSENIAQLVDMFCLLFDLKCTGLRLATLDRAMCPKFHVDRVPCRLVTTYQGAATQWLAHQSVNREKLGIGSDGLPDDQSGLYKSESDIQQLNCDDVALLKGEVWEANENAGLVHRSPALAAGERRLLLTLDFSI